MAGSFCWLSWLSCAKPGPVWSSRNGKGGFEARGSPSQRRPFQTPSEQVFASEKNLAFAKEALHHFFLYGYTSCCGFPVGVAIVRTVRNRPAQSGTVTTHHGGSVSVDALCVQHL